MNAVCHTLTPVYLESESILMIHRLGSKGFSTSRASQRFSCGCLSTRHLEPCPAVPCRAPPRATVEAPTVAPPGSTWWVVPRPRATPPDRCRRCCCAGVHSCTPQEMMGILGLGPGPWDREATQESAGCSWWQLVAVNVYSDSLRLVRQLFM